MRVSGLQKGPVHRARFLDVNRQSHVATVHYRSYTVTSTYFNCLHWPVATTQSSSRRTSIPMGYDKTCLFVYTQYAAYICSNTSYALPMESLQGPAGDPWSPQVFTFSVTSHGASEPSLWHQLRWLVCLTESKSGTFGANSSVRNWDQLRDVVIYSHG